jgi:hypothetical protein
MRRHFNGPSSSLAGTAIPTPSFTTISQQMAVKLGMLMDM